MGKVSMNITIDEESNDTIEGFLEEKIKITDKHHIKAFSNKSQLIDHLLKLGIIQYVSARKNDETGAIL